jgi:aldehyde:ferredoxin oxidoreductase
MKSASELRRAHRILASYSYKPTRIDKGYTDRRLYVNLTANVIEERPIDPMVKEKFTGGRGYGLYYLWQAVAPTTHWNDPSALVR